MSTAVKMTIVTILYILTLFLTLILASSATPLDDYVWAEDRHYKWVDTNNRISGRSLDNTTQWTGYVLNMTSQQWLTPDDVSIRCVLIKIVH